MIVGMGDTVLAGPVEFSPAEIAAIVAFLIGIFVVVTAPGWAALGYACVRRRRARGATRSWPAALGGCCAGLVLSAGVCAAVGGVLDDAGSAVIVVGVCASWVACWVLASVLTRPATVAEPESAGTPPEGWGR